MDLLCFSGLSRGVHWPELQLHFSFDPKNRRKYGLISEVKEYLIMPSILANENLFREILKTPLFSYLMMWYGNKFLLLKKKKKSHLALRFSFDLNSIHQFSISRV